MSHVAEMIARIAPRGALVLAGTLAACAPAPTQPRDVLPGTATPVAEVFWISRCASVLREVVSVEPTGGTTAGLELGIERNQMLQPPQCQPGVLVPGALITVRMTQSVTAPETRDITFVVNYDTMMGPQTSRHTRSIRLLPSAAPRPGA